MPHLAVAIWNRQIRRVGVTGCGWLLVAMVAKCGGQMVGCWGEPSAGSPLPTTRPPQAAIVENGPNKIKTRTVKNETQMELFCLREVVSTSVSHGHPTASCEVLSFHRNLH